MCGPFVYCCIVFWNSLDQKNFTCTHSFYAQEFYKKTNDKMHFSSLFFQGYKIFIHKNLCLMFLNCEPIHWKEPPHKTASFANSLQRESGDLFKRIRLNYKPIQPIRMDSLKRTDSGCIGAAQTDRRIKVHCSPIALAVLFMSYADTSRWHR